MKWEPHSYQMKALQLMMTQSALALFMDPGLGKTSTVLAAFKILKQKGFVKKMLIIAPLRPAYLVWPEEIIKWDYFQDLTYTILHGPKKDKALQEDVDIYVINPEGLKWLYEQQERPVFDAVCVDESTKFKNSQAQRFKLMRQRWEQFSRRWILTGSPRPNGLEDVFGQVFILDQGNALGRYITHFRMKFFEKGYNNWDWKPREGAFEEIVERIAPLTIQLDAEDHLKMPKLMNIPIPVVMPEKARRWYTELEDEFFAIIEDEIITAPNAAAAGTKLRQMCNGAIYTAEEYTEIHDVKLEALEDLIEELSGAPLLLLYEFRHDIDRICHRLGDIPYIGGGVSPKKADGYIKRFNTGDLPVLAGHPASMGHGLNLQGTCHHVCWFGITWNYEYYDQAVRRVYRQGQQKDTVYNYHIIAKDTLDEVVMRTLVDKKKNQRNLQNALKAYREGE